MSAAEPGSSVGELCAERFLQALDGLSFESSGRHVVDYLPDDIAPLLFGALLELADRESTILVPHDEGAGHAEHKLLTIPRARFDVFPFLVADQLVAGARNEGKEGFASCLRDHFAVGAARPRVLVVITRRGNETQRSARDVLADRELITLKDLVSGVARRHDIGADHSLRKVADVYLERQRKGVSWTAVVERLDRYLEAAKDLSPEEQGRRLVELGCFLPDPSADFATGERVDVLDEKQQKRRSRAETRLEDNALLRSWLEEILDNPLEDAERKLTDLFENRPEQAAEIARGGLAGLVRLELDGFKGLKQRQHREKNAFDLSRLDIEGATGWRLVGHEDHQLLAVTSEREIRVTIGLARKYDPRKERALVVGWNAATAKHESRPVVGMPDASDRVTFVLPAPDRGTFATRWLLLAKGPRSLRNPVDLLEVAVHGGEAREVVIEEGRELSLEDQAWVVAGEPRFVRYHGAGGDAVGEPLEIARIETEEPSGGGDDATVTRVRLSGSSLIPRIVEREPEVNEEDLRAEPLLELAAYAPKTGERLRTALAAAPSHLEAVTEIAQDNGAWRVELRGGVIARVSSFSPDPELSYEATVAAALASPDVWRWERGLPSGESASTVEAVAFPEDGGAALEELRAARHEAFAALSEVASTLQPKTLRGVARRVPLPLLPMFRARDEIARYRSAWDAACDTALAASQQYGRVHDALLQIDTLRIVAADRGITRLVVLPTHPWMLSALLRFQDTLGASFASGRKPALTRDEVASLPPRAVLEEWYTGDLRLALVASAPFHLEFRPDAEGQRDGTLDYVERVVATKISRYLKMHPHLRNQHRTLRIGFMNPGSGRHLLRGIEQWLRGMLRERHDQLRILPAEEIPAVDVFLFGARGADTAELGSELEAFFREHVGTADDDIVRQTMLARIRYRKTSGRGPASTQDAVHICFVHGLVDSKDLTPRIAPLNEWWDGAFGDGLLATYLRRTQADAGNRQLHSRRGLWLDAHAGGLRGTLARILVLQRGCCYHDVSDNKAIYRECALPDLRQLDATYEHSDWVVHLDRELSLELFRPTDDSVPRIIEYSDQEVPESPGYDTITVTRHAMPYREQLGEILTTANLDVRGRDEAARKAANAILDDINALSGSWALDFLMGSIADYRYSMRLKGNVGAALVYRWLKRREQPVGGRGVIETNVGPVIPVFISLEELLRVTPAAGLSAKAGLAYRFSNEVEGDVNASTQYCDDLLVVYVGPSRSGQPSRLYGRVIEVKFGTSAIASREKAAKQVRTTQHLLQKHLAGDPHSVDATFRHKQLSLLLKAQIEQAVAIGALRPDVYDFLNVPALSSNLATGDYTVDYHIGVEGQHLAGDVFLLHTGESANRDVITEVRDGVRVLTISRPLVEWLAFELSDAPTLRHSPSSTLPALGRYSTVQTDPGRRPEPPEPPPPPAAVEGNGDVADPAVADPADDGNADDDGGRPPSEEPSPVEPAGASARGTVDVSLAEASRSPIKEAPYPDGPVVDAVRRLEQALVGHKIRLDSAPSVRETDRGPRLLRVYIRLEPGESINSVRRISEDIARVVGTASQDIHISNVPERHAVGLDLPIPGLEYAVGYEELVRHASFAAARRELTLGFCAGIDVTGRPLWTDLARMPHMLVAGTTGSGKTVFLRNVILTLLQARQPADLTLRMSSSKPMDFRLFTNVPHARGLPIATEPADALSLARELVDEMERRIVVITDAVCDNLAEYNREQPDAAIPYIVAVFDEYAEMVASFGERAERGEFESAMGRLAQKARAAGIHLIICMQRPDVNAIKGAIKANILHRFALKLPQNQDSRVILDETGAENLLGMGDLLYKDANSRIFRLQVPNLENAVLKEKVRSLGNPAAMRSPTR